MANEWEVPNAVFNQVLEPVNAGVESIFNLVGNVFGAMHLPIMVAAAIYIALMGYALISGYITLSAREAATRISKVVLVLIIAGFFRGYGTGLYDFFWELPLDLAGYVCDFLGVSYSASGGTADDPGFQVLIDAHSTSVTHVSERFSQDHQTGNMIAPMIFWFLMMAPVLVFIITIVLAKTISAVVIMMGPIVLILALLSLPYNFLMSWLKLLLMVFVTAIFAYIFAAFCLAILDGMMTDLLAARPGTSPDTKIFVQDIFPIIAVSIFGVVLISQATTIATALGGVAGYSSQQGTSFLQLGAMQAAARGR